MNSQTQLYQLELEVQNSELISSRHLLEETLNLYSNLYDYAAVACLTLTSKGVIAEMNLTAAALFQQNRDRMIGRPFTAYLRSESQSSFFSHLRKCAKYQTRVTSRLFISDQYGGQQVLLITEVRRASSSSPSDLKKDKLGDKSLIFQSSIVEMKDFEGS